MKGILFLTALLLTTSSAVAQVTGTTSIVGQQLDGIDVSASGDIYVATSQAGTVVRITPDGQQQVAANVGGYTVGVGLNSQGVLYVTDYNSGELHRVTPQGQQSVVATGMIGAGNIIIDESDNVFVAALNENRVYRVTREGNKSVLVSGIPNPLGIAIDENGTLYTADPLGSRIYRISSAGNWELLANVPITTGQYKIGNLVYLNGALYATGFANHRIYRIELDGSVTEFAGDGIPGNRDGENPRFNGPNGITVSADGNGLLVSEYGGRRIRSVDFPMTESVDINFGMSGGWFDPLLNGQGFMIDVIEGSGQLFVTWFVFKPDEPGNQHWYGAFGNYSGASATLELFESVDGDFEGFMVAEEVPVGELRLVFSTCTTATADFQINGGPSGALELIRLAPDVLCETLR